MRDDKGRALRLRSFGKSYREIRNILGLPKSTLSDWLRKIKWSRKIKKDLAEKAKANSRIVIRRLNKIRGRHLARLYREAREEAKKEFEYFKLHPLFVIGIAIYWGEGDRSSRYLVRVANTDPLMMRLFVRFLQEICGLPKTSIRAHVLIYPDLNPEKCKDFWRKAIGLSLKNFNKCVTIKGRHKTRRLPYGVCYAGVTSTYLKEKIAVWLQLLPEELAKEIYYPRE